MSSCKPSGSATFRESNWPRTNSTTSTTQWRSSKSPKFSKTSTSTPSPGKTPFYGTSDTPSSPTQKASVKIPAISTSSWSSFPEESSSGIWGRKSLNPITHPSTLPKFSRQSTTSTPRTSSTATSSLRTSLSERTGTWNWSISGFPSN